MLQVMQPQYLELLQFSQPQTQPVKQLVQSLFSGGVGINNDLHVGGDITAFSSSDINLKENINVIPNALDKVNAISGNTFTWKSGKGDDTGVIAQEIEALGLPGD